MDRKKEGAGGARGAGWGRGGISGRNRIKRGNSWNKNVCSSINRAILI